MGNDFRKSRIRYKDQMLRLNINTNNSFESTKNYIRAKFNIDNSVPIVLSENMNYVSTEYNWRNFTRANRLNNLVIWPQVEDFIQIGFQTTKYLPFIFKLQKKISGRIISIGLFISENICILPYYVLNDNPAEYLEKCNLVFFNETVYNLNRNYTELVIDDEGREKQFILLKIEEFLNEDLANCELIIPENTRRVSGHIIFFNSNTQMLSGRTETILNADSSILRINQENWIPGSFFISKRDELVGMCSGRTGNNFYSISWIIKNLSNMLDRAMQDNDEKTRNMILQIKHVDIKIPYFADVLNMVASCNPTHIETFNPLNLIHGK